MKNIINYYYNLKVEKVVYHDNKYYFNVGEINYILKELLIDVPLYDSLLQQLNNYDYFFKIQKNIKGNFITIINQKKYILLWQKKYLNYRICLNDLQTKYHLTINNYYHNEIHWIKLWENKIDTFEKIVDSKKTQNSQLLPIFNYYIGVGETAILYLKKAISNQKNSSSSLVASHRRISINTTLYDYYDPTNIIVDYPSRDIAEYVKSAIINKCFDINEFDNYIEKTKFQKFELQLLFARLMFPTFFFDYIEENTNINEKKLKNEIEKYEFDLCNINMLLSKKYDIETVDWIYKNKAKY